MFESNDLIFMGLILVGSALTVRVVVEGKAENGLIRAKVKKFKEATDACIEKTQEIAVKAQTLATEVEGLTQELDATESRKSHLEKKIGGMKQRLDKTSRVK